MRQFSASSSLQSNHYGDGKDTFDWTIFDVFGGQTFPVCPGPYNFFSWMVEKSSNARLIAYSYLN